jgi:hypothetical protein
MSFPDYVPLHWPRPGQPALRPGTEYHLPVGLGVWGEIRLIGRQPRVPSG